MPSPVQSIFSSHSFCNVIIIIFIYCKKYTCIKCIIRYVMEDRTRQIIFCETLPATRQNHATPGQKSVCMYFVRDVDHRRLRPLTSFFPGVAGVVCRSIRRASRLKPSLTVSRFMNDGRIFTLLFGSIDLIKGHDMNNPVPPYLGVRF